MNTCIGDRQLEPDEEHECPHCFGIFGSVSKLKAHASKCAKNDDIDYPEDDYFDCQYDG